LPDTNTKHMTIRNPALPQKLPCYSLLQTVGSEYIIFLLRIEIDHAALQRQKKVQAFSLWEEKIAEHCIKF